MEISGHPWKNGIGVQQKPQSGLNFSEDNTQHGDHKDVKIDPIPSPSDADREISLQMPDNDKPEIKPVPASKICAKQTRELFFLLNDLGELSRRAKPRRRASLIVPNRQSSPKKAWESRRFERRRSRSIERRSSPVIQSPSPLPVNLSDSIQLESDKITVTEPIYEEIPQTVEQELHEKPFRHSSFILRSNSEYENNDILDSSLKISYNRKLAFPAYQEEKGTHPIPIPVFITDVNDNSLLYTELEDLFHPKIKDVCRTLEPDAYSSLLTHWEGGGNDAEFYRNKYQPSREPDPCLQIVKKGIMLPYPRPPTLPEGRKTVTFVPDTVFVERNPYSNFWLRIYAQRHHRRAMNKLNAHLSNRRRGITGRPRSRRSITNANRQKACAIRSLQVQAYDAAVAAVPTAIPTSARPNSIKKRSVFSISKFFAGLSMTCCGLCFHKRKSH